MIGVNDERSTKVVGIRLPIDHPLFLVEAGKRGEVARIWLDAGARMERIEQQVERILAILEANPSAARTPEPDRTDSDFDKDSFLSCFG